MILESWETLILHLSFGSLIGGILLFLFSLITAEFHFGHDGSDISDLSSDSDLHFGDLSSETEIHIGGSFDLDGGIDADSHFEIGHSDTDISGHTKLEHNPSTPILLVISTFFLMFGAVGITIYESEIFNPILRLILAITIPIGFVKGISILWKKYTSVEHGYEIPTVTIDNQVKTLTNVDEKGGLVLADTGDYDRPETLRTHEKMKMQAKTLPGILIERDSIAYVVDIDEKNTLIIDSWPKLSKKKNVV